MAIKYYNKSISASEKFVDAYVNKSDQLAKLNEYDEALQTLDEAMKINPDNATAYYNLGVIHSTLKDFEKAIQATEKVFGKILDFPKAVSE